MLIDSLLVHIYYCIISYFIQPNTKTNMTLRPTNQNNIYSDPY